MKRIMLVLFAALLLLSLSAAFVGCHSSGDSSGSGAKSSTSQATFK